MLKTKTVNEIKNAPPMPSYFFGPVYPQQLDLQLFMRNTLGADIRKFYINKAMPPEPKNSVDIFDFKLWLEA